MLVVGNDGATIGLIAPQDHVTASLSAEDKSSALKHLTDFAAG